GIAVVNRDRPPARVLVIGGHVDDVAPLPPDHAWDHGSAHQEGAAQIRADGGVEGVDGLVPWVEWVRAAYDRGVVDKHLHRFGIVHEALHSIGISYVGDDRLDASTRHVFHGGIDVARDNTPSRV